MPWSSCRAVFGSLAVSGLIAAGLLATAATAGAGADPAVTARLVAVEPDRRFPKSHWTFDVTLENRHAEAVWFLIPEPPERGFELHHGAHAVEVEELGSGAKRARLVRISATHTLLALRLAPGARLALHDLRLTSWSEVPLEQVEIWMAEEILLDGRPLTAETLGGADPGNVGETEVDATSSRELHSWADPEFAEHPLGFEPRERWTLPVDLGDLDPPWSQP